MVLSRDCHMHQYRHFDHKHNVWLVHHHLFVYIWSPKSNWSFSTTFGGVLHFDFGVQIWYWWSCRLCCSVYTLCVLDPASIVLLLIVCSCAAMISASVLSFSLEFPAIGRITLSLISLICFLFTLWMMDWGGSLHALWGAISLVFFSDLCFYLLWNLSMVSMEFLRFTQNFQKKDKNPKLFLEVRLGWDDRKSTAN